MGVKKNQKISLTTRVLFGIPCGIGLASAFMTSVHNNSISTGSKYGPIIAYAQSISTALAIIIPLFLRYKTAFFRVMVIFTVAIASIFSINGISIDEKDKTEDRLKTDPVYQQRYQTWDNFSKEFQSAQVTVDKYIELQMTSTRSWNDGAKAARLRRDSLAVQKATAYQLLITRQNELLKSGSKSNEAYIEFLSAATFSLFGDTMLTNISHILYALMPDLQMIVFAAILSFLFREWVSIPVPKSFGGRSGAFGKRSVNSGSVRWPFGNSSVNLEDTGLHSSGQIRGVRKIVQLFTEHPNMNLTELGILAAQEIGRKFENGAVRPFSKSFVCEVLKGKYTTN